ncbi:subtilisin-like protein [Vararia minispora EC-137]|uniref:Subtilisin-like protein n=1 Tax=Vararia minispora EC-137 TaxID=1314806 RepID=A0ACB8QAM1_9AGAM|nr:subtilisin-like protein [Vararia minispora EC-137]
MRSLIQVLVLCAIASAGTFKRADHVLHERRAMQPVSWVRERRLEADKILPLRIGLKQQNMDRVEDMLLSVSHPDSPTYAQHWSAERVVNFFAPHEDTVSAVTAWLAEYGLTGDRVRLSPNKGWLETELSVAEAEELLGAEYHVYSHASGIEQIGCERYHVPDYVSEHIDIIKPTVHFNHRARGPDAPPKFRKRESVLGQPSSNNGPKTNGQLATGSSDPLANCDREIVPDCLRALYSINYKPVATKKNSYGIVEFTPQAFLAGDLDLFFSNFSSGQIGDRPVLVSIDGGVAQTQNQSFNFNGESDLDLEYAMSLTNPQPILLLQTGDLVEGAGFDNWLDAVDKSFCTFEGGDDPTQDGIYPDKLPGGFNHPESCGIIKPPNVVSVSYGQDEATVTPKFANRQCQEYAKLGLMGTTVLYSSGDDGVAGFGGACLLPNGSEPTTVNGNKFNPSFPGGCPFITSVGATMVPQNKTVADPETACELVIFSGGGFSNIFPLPSYQASAVTSFLKNHPPPFTSAQFNNSGKALPPGIDGQFALVFGTSASSPVVGSIITLINDARIANGKGPVGFINPVIYSEKFRSAFHDITVGGNQGCGTPGFQSTEGWDPVTGVGTPNMTALLPLFLSLP